MANKKGLTTDVQNKVHEIGTAIHEIAIPGAAYAKDANGKDRIYAVAGGDPAILNIINPRDGEHIDSFSLEGASNAWGVTADPGGVVYIGSYSNASLYRYDPLTNIVKNLGQPIPDEKFIWRMCSDEKGRIYGGTYPGGKVFQYNPHTDSFKDYGQIIKGQNYVRSIGIYHEKVYVGIGTNGVHIIELDVETGNKKEITLPEKYRKQTNVYDINIIEDTLFARITGINTVLVYDLKEMKLIDEIHEADGLDISQPGPNKLVYLIINNHLHSYDLEKSELLATPFENYSSARNFAWVELNDDEFPGLTLISIASNGDIRHYNPTNGHSRTIKNKLPGQPVKIQSLTRGPNGNIFIGGYFSGGLSEYDCHKEQLINYKGIGQIEGMTTHANKLYMGIYTQARIYSYDPYKPYNFGENPVEHFNLKKHDQDRPFAIISAADQIAIGTVPDYGKLQGALTMYNPKTDHYKIYNDIISNQSIISLAYRDGYVYGGTSVSGGLGIDPVEQEAKIFMWDVQKQAKVMETVPIKNEMAIAALAFDENGYLWGLTIGKIFKYDVQNKKMILNIKLYESNREKLSHFWRGGVLIFDQDGYLYGQTVGNIFKLNLDSLEFETLAKDTELLAQDIKGNFYFARDHTLYQYVK